MDRFTGVTMKEDRCLFSQYGPVVLQIHDYSSSCASTVQLIGETNEARRDCRTMGSWEMCRSDYVTVIPALPCSIDPVHVLAELGDVLCRP